MFENFVFRIENLNYQSKYYIMVYVYCLNLFNMGFLVAEKPSDKQILTNLFFCLLGFVPE